MTVATSLLIPGLIGLLNDLRLQANLPPLGFLNPLLYYLGRTNPSVFTDITVGGNWACNSQGASVQAFIADFILQDSPQHRAGILSLALGRSTTLRWRKLSISCLVSRNSRSKLIPVVTILLKVIINKFVVLLPTFPSFHHVINEIYL